VEKSLFTKKDVRKHVALQHQTIMKTSICSNTTTASNVGLVGVLMMPNQAKEVKALNNK
jgi:hypothetical protein